MSKRYSARPPRGAGRLGIDFGGGGAPVWSSSGGGTPWWWQRWPRGWDPLGWWRTRARGWSPRMVADMVKGMAPLPRMVAAMEGMGPICSGAPHPGCPVILHDVRRWDDEDGRPAWIARPGSWKQAPLGAASFPPTVSGIDARQRWADCPGVLRGPKD